MRPSIRYSGGTPAVTCRSDAPFWVMSCSRSRSVTTFALLCTRAAVAGRRLQFVRCRLLEDFRSAGHAALELLQTVPSQREHPFADRRLLDLRRRGPVERQVADAGRHRHHLVDALPSPVAGAAALDAARALGDRGLLG